MESSLAMDCIRSGQPYYVADVSEDPIFNPEFDAVDDIPVRSVFCTPLISNSQTVGVVEVDHVATTISSTRTSSACWPPWRSHSQTRSSACT